MGSSSACLRLLRTVLVTAALLAAAASPAGAAERLFADDSVWNKRVAARADVDRSSERIVSAIAADARVQVEKAWGPWIATSAYSTPIIVAGPRQRTRRVSLDDPRAHWRVSLQDAFDAVPIPEGARPAPGSDGHMTIWQPSTDRLWEFWQARRERDGWHASWGGAMENVSRSDGYYSTRSMPGAESYWGSTATSLPVAGGVITLAEMRAGRIDHALAMNVPAPRADVFAWPAQRTDGENADPSAIPAGAKLRLDPRLDIDRLRLPPVARMIALAAQRYGIIVRDRTRRGFLFFTEDVSWRGPDPYVGKNGLLGGLPPNVLLKDFPWHRLQVLEMDLHREA